MQDTAQPLKPYSDCISHILQQVPCSYYLGGFFSSYQTCAALSILLKRLGTQPLRKDTLVRRHCWQHVHGERF